MTTNKAAERLRPLMDHTYYANGGSSKADLFEEALAAERRNTVEQIRARCGLGYFQSSDDWEHVNQILDEVAPSPTDESPRDRWHRQWELPDEARATGTMEDACGSCPHPKRSHYFGDALGADGRMHTWCQKQDCPCQDYRLPDEARAGEPRPRHPYEIATERLTMHLNGQVARGRLQAIAEQIVDAIEREAAAAPALDVDLVEQTLQSLWRWREADGSLTFTIPVPPDNKTARVFAAEYVRLSGKDR